LGGEGSRSILRKTPLSGEVSPLDFKPSQAKALETGDIRKPSKGNEAGRNELLTVAKEVGSKGDAPFEFEGRGGETRPEGGKD